MASEDLTALRVDDIRVTPGATVVLDGASLDVAGGEVVAVLGASGSGKTTLLRAIAGLEAVDAGRILWRGHDVTGVAAHRRGFGLMFQDHALFPHRDVAANVAFGLRMQRRPRPQRRERVAEVLEMLGIGHLASRSVGDLSGGEAQRVALGRVLAPEPGLVLFDEPLSSLDRPLRDRLVGDLRTVLAGLEQTALYVTHDFDEAAAVADRVAVLRDGVVARVATPVWLRADPGDAATAAMVGHPNVIDAVGEGGVLRTAFGPVRGWRGPAGPVSVAVAPGAVDLGDCDEGDATVRSVTVHGDGYRVAVDVGGGHRLVVAVTGATPPAPGRRVVVRIDPDGVAVLDVAADTDDGCDDTAGDDAS